MSLKPNAVTILRHYRQGHRQGHRNRNRDHGHFPFQPLKAETTINQACQGHLLHVQDASAVHAPLVHFSAGGRSSPAEQTLTKSLR